MSLIRIVFFRVLSLILAVVLVSCDTSMNEIMPKGENIPEQTFETSFKNFKKVKFASYNDYSVGPAKVYFYLLKDERVIYQFPDYHIWSTSWSFESIKAVAFKDVNADGLKDVVIIAEYVTGIGPTGMIPFLVKGVYFQGSDQFTTNIEISNLINSEKNYKKIKTISAVVKYMKTINDENITGKYDR